MSQKHQTTRSPANADRIGEEADGRRARSERSRGKIIAAVLKLVQGGNISPGAQLVADEAKVSLRTVYRHFEDMESLYKEIASALEARFMPVITRPYESLHWKDRLREHLDRRLQVFEDIMYLRLSTIARRFQSDFLTEEHNRAVKLEQLSLEALVPDHLLDDTQLTAALDIILCFETYHRLRLESGYAPETARDILTRMLETVLRDVADVRSV